MEKAYKSFKPVDYDLSQHLKAIDAFEAKAVESAEQTASKIEGELKQLNATLSDIENARPFEDLTLQDIAKARPEIPKTVDTMVSKGKWTVDGYKVCSGILRLACYFETNVLRILGQIWRSYCEFAKICENFSDIFHRLCKSVHYYCMRHSLYKDVLCNASSVDNLLLFKLSFKERTTRR